MKILIALIISSMLLLGASTPLKTPSQKCDHAAATQLAALEKFTELEKRFTELEAITPENTMAPPEAQVLAAQIFGLLQLLDSVGIFIKENCREV